VLDALTGMCHPDCQYKDPPNTTLPTEDDISKLPRWARVAFAARCARRVQLLYRHFWAEAPEAQVFTVALTVEYTELVAACDLPPYDEDVTVAGYAQAAHEADLLATPFGDGCYAAATASFAGDYAFRVMNDAPDDSAYMAASAAVRAAESVANLRPVIRRDFDHLAELARWRKWTDDTPVPPEVFGPLWPEGLPKGWPVDESLTATELPLRFLVRNGTKPAVSEDEAVNLFNILNQYHIARTGVRLTLEGDIYTRLAQLVGVGV
ncbi:MAG TPA: hypothetical protein VMZ71_08335, partial [Gemmataceae bacterium]|nr:hypothetical protein [Gemmataceae bacterium]